MIINVTPLAEGKVLRFSFKEILQLDNSYNLYDYNVEVEVDGSLSKQGTLYICKAEVIAQVKFNCDKCLKLVGTTLQFSLEEKFSNVEYFKAEEEEVNIFSDSQIDLKCYVEANLFINIPMQVVCAENCKGLCLTCGTDLNAGDCTCDNVVLDPRFDALRSLFSNDEEV